MPSTHLPQHTCSQRAPSKEGKRAQALALMTLKTKRERLTRIEELTAQNRELALLNHAQHTLVAQLHEIKNGMDEDTTGLAGCKVNESPRIDSLLVALQHQTLLNSRDNYRSLYAQYYSCQLTCTKKEAEIQDIRRSLAHIDARETYLSDKHHSLLALCKEKGEAISENDYQEASSRNRKTGEPR